MQWRRASSYRREDITWLPGRRYAWPRCRVRAWCCPAPAARSMFSVRRRPSSWRASTPAYSSTPEGASSWCGACSPPRSTVRAAWVAQEGPRAEARRHPPGVEVSLGKDGMALGTPRGGGEDRIEPRHVGATGDRDGLVTDDPALPCIEHDGPEVLGPRARAGETPVALVADTSHDNDGRTIAEPDTVVRQQSSHRFRSLPDDARVLRIHPAHSYRRQMVRSPLTRDVPVPEVDAEAIIVRLVLRWHGTGSIRGWW
jgi:hypothetical protein